MPGLKSVCNPIYGIVHHFISLKKILFCRTCGLAGHSSKRLTQGLFFVATFSCSARVYRVLCSAPLNRQFCRLEKFCSDLLNQVTQVLANYRACSKYCFYRRFAQHHGTPPERSFQPWKENVSWLLQARRTPPGVGKGFPMSEYQTNPWQTRYRTLNFLTRSSLAMVHCQRVLGQFTDSVNVFLCCCFD